MASGSASKTKTSQRVLWEDKTRVGLIDVGSNTVRFVVFDLEGRLPQPVFNERAFCGLGDAIGSTGKLSLKSQRKARQTIHRFTSLAKQMKVDHLDIFATSAVRDATNGQCLIDAVKEDTSYEMRVLTGEQEALHSGMGVLAGIPDAQGLAGDLGGGSLELAVVKKGRIGKTVSLPLGTLRLMDMFGDDVAAARKHIDVCLDSVPWLADYAGEGLYTVGGTWRSLAKYHMQSRDYPLRILHQYEIPATQAGAFASKTFKQNDPEAAIAAGISGKRARMLPIASLVMERMLKKAAPSKVVISALGLREGILYDNARRDLRKKDPLIEFCKDTARRQSRFPEYGKELRRWVAPLFEGESEEQYRLRQAVCFLADIGWTGHPEYRAEFAMDQVMQRQILGVTHADRAFIGLALFVANGGGAKGTPGKSVEAMLRREDIMRAQQIGLALRLAHRISGGTKKLLGRCALAMDEKAVTLSIPARYDYMVGESVQGRLKTLSHNMKRKAVVEVV